AGPGLDDLVNLAVEHVGHDLTPQPRARAAADEADRFTAGADEALEVLHQPARVEGHALVDRAEQLGPTATQREVVKARADRVVGDGRALAVEPGREDQAVAAGRRGAGEGLDAGPKIHGDRTGAEGVVGKQEVIAEVFEAQPRGLLGGRGKVAT